MVYFKGCVHKLEVIYSQCAVQMLELPSDIWATLPNKNHVYHLDIFWWPVGQHQCAFDRAKRSFLIIQKGLQLVPFECPVPYSGSFV